jgi:hypothetical protein
VPRVRYGVSGHGRPTENVANAASSISSMAAQLKRQASITAGLVTWRNAVSSTT